MAEIMDKYGADGIQIASRFVLSEECDVADEFKQAYLDAGKDDIVLTTSPVGMPGRALRTPFVKALAKGIDFTTEKCKHLCLKKCDHHYCINERLMASKNGNLEEGLFFSGENTYKMKNILPVAEIFKEFVTQAESVYKEGCGLCPSRRLNRITINRFPAAHRDYPEHQGPFTADFSPGQNIPSPRR